MQTFKARFVPGCSGPKIVKTCRDSRDRPSLAPSLSRPLQIRDARPGLAHEHNDLVRGGESIAAFFLREDQRAVDANLEDASITFHERNRHTEFVPQLGLQPGGLGEIVSTNAILNRDLHVDHSL